MTIAPQVETAASLSGRASASTLSALVLAVALSACGAQSDEATSPKASPTATSRAPTSPVDTTTETPTATETESPTPAAVTGVTVEYRCEGQKYSTMQEAWLYKHPNCIDTKAMGTPNKRESAAVRLAYGPKAKVTLRALGSLYGGCGANNRWWPVCGKNDSMSAEWAQEQAGQNLLCPDHPHMDQAQAAIARSLKRAEQDRNRIQYDGTYIVGETLNPGTYVARPTGACYWERTDDNGNIIDNNFSHGARIQFTVLPSDYSISVQGCGEWQRVNS